MSYFLRVWHTSCILIFEVRQVAEEESSESNDSIITLGDENLDEAQFSDCPPQTSLGDSSN